MLEVIVLLIVVLLVYLYLTYGRVCSDDLSNIAGFTKGETMLMADVSEFSRQYGKHSKEFIEARLNKKDEHTKVLEILKEAMNKGKRMVSYKDVPHSPKMYEAFSHLVHDPDVFFAELSDQSKKVSEEQKSFVGNQSNVSNLGLQIVNDIRPQDRAKHMPTPPSTSWKYIERSRGPH